MKVNTLNLMKVWPNAFNVFFTKIGPVLDNEIPRKPMDPKMYLKNKIPHSFLITPTTPQEVYGLIDELDDNKSSGPCSIPSKFLKLINGNISIPFSDICNTSFKEDVFPDKNKYAKVIPTHKRGSTKDVNNYRPISLLSIFSKIMEKLIVRRLNDFLELHSVIYPNQFGFRAGHSTTHSLINLVETINKTIDSRKYGCGIFIDLKKAFDTVQL